MQCIYQGLQVLVFAHCNPRLAHVEGRGDAQKRQARFPTNPLVMEVLPQLAALCLGEAENRREIADLPFQGAAVGGGCVALAEDPLVAAALCQDAAEMEANTLRRDAQSSHAAPKRRMQGTRPTADLAVSAP